MAQRTAVDKPSRHARRELARTVMTEHGLEPDVWRLKWGDGKTVIGYCDYARKTITLSTHLVRYGTDDEYVDTLLHEIAHALVGPDVQRHGPTWKATAKRIGCSGDRCWKGADFVQRKYEIKCPCGKSCYKRHSVRRAHYKWICKHCKELCIVNRLGAA